MYKIYFLFCKYGLVLVMMWIATSQIMSQTPNDSIQKFQKRKKLVTYGSVGLYAANLGGLYALWYKDVIDTTRFQFFDDSGDWLQMDKFRHLAGGQYLSLQSIYALRWAGVKDKKAIWWGGVIGWTMMTPVEIYDGFDSESGFSLSDLAFNTIGSLSAVLQELYFRDQILLWKYSYNDSGIAHYRPELLGETLPQKMFRDLNGQTYWLSINIKKTTRLNVPPWLNIAIGHSADGLLGGSSNPEFNDDGLKLPELNRVREWYVSFDVDLSKIKTNSKLLKTALNFLNVIKIPAPAIEVKDGDVRFIPIYF